MKADETPPVTGAGDGDTGSSRPRRTAPPRSPYATGGGGVVLEHDHAAYLLAHLLLPDPLPGLGDEFRVVEVAFQAHQLSPVDDAVVTGLAPGGERRTFAVAVRRDPVIGASDVKFTKLWGQMVEATRSNLDRIALGAYRIGLVVVGPHGPTRELRELARVARGHPSGNDFRAAIEAGPVPLKNRLRLVEGLTAKAADACVGGEAPIDVPGVSWQVLVCLHAMETFLEGADARDRGNMIGRLAAISPSGDGLALWQGLTGLARRYVPNGAWVDEAILRRDLVGVIAISRSGRTAQAWAALDELERLAETQTSDVVASHGRRLTLPRTELRQQIGDAVASERLLVVTGKPDTGKSAIVAAVVRDLKGEGAAVMSLNLRDVPASHGGLITMLGATPGDVFAGYAVADRRILVLDGAEAVQEAHRPAFLALTSAAAECGISVTVVCRDDAAPSLQRALEDATRSIAGLAVVTQTVAGLEGAEVTALRGTFPEFETIAAEPKAAWLLTRPGLVDMLLRADAVRALPPGPIAEADVFVAVWAELVRNREGRTPGGAMPDEREQALLQLGRARLLPSSPIAATNGTAVASLRSDGLLRTRDAAAPWQSDDFASDLVRDFSVAALLDRGDFQLLTEAGAPRWAVRAARVAVQARLLRSAEPERTRREIQAYFDGLAGVYGERWIDVPWEGLLDPRMSALLPGTWLTLATNHGAELRRVLRLIGQRHATLSALDPLVAGPVAEILLDHTAEWQATRELREGVERFLLEWLAGLAIRADADVTDDARVRAGGLLLTDTLIRDEEERLQALATLGIDLDEAAAAELRSAARARPHELRDCVEDVFARVSLARRQPALLLELAEAYYIEPPRRRGFGYGGFRDDGIRHHRFLGLGAPMAAPYYGPFRELLAVRPREAISFVNRLLDHAAAARIRILEDLGSDPGPRPAIPAVQLRIGPEPDRPFVGDRQVWGWYRGNTVGPYPAMSALMAVEDWADTLLRAGVTVRRIADLLLAEAHSLAMPGLVYGLLVRHLDAVTNELDDFLRQPLVWHFEFGRVVTEGGLLTRTDEATRYGAARRRHSPREVAAELVFRATSRGDLARLDQLAAIGRHLDTQADAIDDAEGAAVIRQWAASFDRDRYEVTAATDHLEVRHVPPNEVEAALATTNEDLRRGQHGWRLLMTYTRPEVQEDLSNLIRDITTARVYHAHPPASGPNEGAGPAAAVAMVALKAHADGRIAVPDDDLAWAISVLVDVLADVPGPEKVAFGGSVFDLGADRSAGRGLTATLRPAYHEDASPTLRATADAPEVERALGNALSSPIDEVRRLTATALRPVWSTECGPIFGGRCRHEVALRLATEAVRFARLGEWDQAGRRPSPLEDPVVEVLANVDPEDLALDWLPSAVIAAADAAATPNCQAGRAQEILRIVLEVQRRALPLYLEHHYKRDEADREPFVIGMLQEAASGRRAPLDAWLSSFTTNSEAVEELLNDAARIATYDPSFREDLAAVWPSVADHLLDALDAGTLVHERAYLEHDAAASVVPSPQIRTADTSIDATLDAARVGWVSLDAARPRIERWIPHAVGCGRCTDSLVQFLYTTPPQAQVQEGLAWVRRLIGGRGEPIGRRSSFASDWLRGLRETGLLDGESRRSYQVVVDALAAAGDRRAADLQALEE